MNEYQLGIGNQFDATLRQVKCCICKKVAGVRNCGDWNENCLFFSTGQHFFWHHKTLDAMFTKKLCLNHRKMYYYYYYCSLLIAYRNLYLFHYLLHLAHLLTHWFLYKYTNQEYISLNWSFTLIYVFHFYLKITSKENQWITLKSHGNYYDKFIKI